jgi:hypothetical protein
MRPAKNSRDSELRTADQPLEVNRFRMEVPKLGYRWLADADTDSLFTDENKLGSAPYLVLNDQEQKDSLVRIYFPLRDTPDLFCRFRDLALDAEAILTFANRFGSIGETSHVIGRGGSAFIPAVGISRWREEIQAMVIVDHLWKCILADDRPTLRRYFKWHRTAFEVILSIGIQGKEILPLNHPYVRDGSARAKTTWLIGERWAEPLSAIGWNHGDVLGPARLAMMDMINPRLLEYCHPRLYLDKDRGFAGHLTPNNLLGCVWLQFYLSIIGQLKLRRCTVCGFEMDVTLSRSTKKMHDLCSKSRRMRKWRGKTAECLGGPP